MQQTQENYTTEKQKYASASDATHGIGPCITKRKNRIDPIFHARDASPQPIGMHNKSSQSSASIHLSLMYNCFCSK